VATQLQHAALVRLDELYRYTLERWGADQAVRYSNGLFAAVDGIADGTTISRPIPAEFGISGFYFRYQSHYVYWHLLSNGDIGIASILHVQMQQAARLRDDLHS